MSNGIAGRVAGLTPSATVAMTERAKLLRSQGERVIGYGAGEPDFPTPDHIIEAAVAACRDPANHSYTPTAGLPELRQAIASKTKRDSDYVADSDQVVVTNGAKQAFYQACQALLDPGDEVLLPAPYWVTYPEAIALAGAVVVPVAARYENGFRVTVDQLEKARTPRTKLLVFTSPSNPTGAVYSPGEVEAIGEWAAEQGIWVVTDEIYEHLVYGQASHASIAAVVPELRPRCIAISGVSKTYAMTGWRVGWMIAPAGVAAAVINLQSHISTNVANVSQRAAIAAVSGDLEAVAAMRKAFDRRRLAMHDLLNAIDGIECHEPEGAFYAFPSVDGLLGRNIRGRKADTTLELAELVLDEIGVLFVPGEPFGAPGYARFSFALSDDELVEGLDRLAVLLGEG